MRMPVLLFRSWKSREKPLRDDVLDAGEIGLRRVAVEQRALREILVDLPAEVMRFGLVMRAFLYRMEADQVDVKSIRRRIPLQDGGARLQHAGFRGRRLAGRLRCRPGRARSGARREHNCRYE